jgi:zinc-binding in reverse transcriptase
MRRKIGVGTTILFWENDWGMRLMKYQFPILFSFSLDHSITVADVHNMESLEQLFRPITSLGALEEFSAFISLITQGLQLNTHLQDEVIWKGDDKGALTVRSIYFAMKDGPRISMKFNTFWKLNVPLRFKVFAWLMLLNIILITDSLKKRGWVLPNICVMCRADEESVHHLLNSCVYIRLLSHILLPDFTNDLPPNLLVAITDIIV